MKRLFITLISFSLMALASSAAKNLEKDITMVSYEQRWLDNEGTLALKNNTGEEICNVVYQITYLDMSGNPLDYEEFTSEVLIAPGMTKKVNIPAYEHRRNYHYYKSEDMPGGSPAFKIQFKLKDYNVEETDNNDKYNVSENNHNVANNNGVLYSTMIIVAILFVIGISVVMYILVAVMAQKRNRNVVVWLFLSVLTTPLLVIIILFFIGGNPDYMEQRYNGEE